jgi:hypothetical protein
LFVSPQFPSSVPSPPRLMFATLMFSAAAFAVTQSMPQNDLCVGARALRVDHL